MKPLRYLLFVAWGTASCAGAAQCTLTTSGLRFGSLSATAALHARALGALVLSCHGRTGEEINYRVQLTSGQGSFRQRIMRSGTNTLAYNLYLDSAGTRIWGDGSDNSVELSGSVRLPGPFFSHLYPLYARILSVPAGNPESYFDNVAVQFEY
jgi:spore coat protein U-like protein